MTPLQSLLLRIFCIWVPLTILMLGPEDSILKYIWKHRFDPKGRLRVWHYETLAVMVLVAAVVMLSGDDPTEWVGFAALTLAHGRNSVMFRFSEAQERASRLDPHHVQCWAWAGRYFLLAECFWAAYFILHRSWAALAGVGIFLGYGQWRKWYGRRQPVKPIPQDPRIATLTEEVRKLRAEADGLRALLEDTQCVLAFARRDLTKGDPEWLKAVVAKEASIAISPAPAPEAAPVGFKELPIDPAQIKAVQVRVTVQGRPTCVQMGYTACEWRKTKGVPGQKCVACGNTKP